jgi:hypothetical protein
MSISSFLNNAEAYEVRTVIRALKREKIKGVADSLLKDYELEFEPYGVTKGEFSHILQTSSPDNDLVRGVINKLVGEGKLSPEDAAEKIKEENNALNSKYLRDLRSGKNNGLMLDLLFGRVNPEIKEKIQDKEEIQSVLAEFELQPGDLKKEVLMASEFNPLMYPVNAENYWPPMKAEYSEIIEEKFLETFDITRPNSVIAAIMSVKNGTIVFDDDADKIKVLYKGKFNSDTESFLNFISETLIKNNNPAETVDDYIQTIRAGLQGSFNKQGEAKDERKRDTVFPEVESYFDSIKEKEIVDLIRGEFNLSCVASAMEFPITNDFTMNRNNFKTDFVIYCDGLEGFQEREKDREKYQVPIIKHRLLLIGEYYGYDSVRASKPLDADLINPDGTPFLKPDGMPALKGDVLTEGQEYKYKTQYKIFTNDFCGRAIGCKTISINKATTKKDQIDEVSDGLDKNMVLYNTSFNDPNIKSSALIKLKNWYINASDLERQESKFLVGYYLNTEKLEELIKNPLIKDKERGITVSEVGKSGKDYPLAMQNPKSRYLSTIYEAMHRIKSIDLSIAIQITKSEKTIQEYSIDTIANKNQADEYLRMISGARAKLVGESGWRLQMLNKLFNEIQDATAEKVETINGFVFVEFIKNISKYSTKGISDEKSPYRKENKSEKKLEYPNIYKVKKAFNYLKAIKRGIIN